VKRWIERWYGSGPDRGWSIWEEGHGDRIAYVGEGEHSERLTSLIVEKHNAALGVSLTGAARDVLAERERQVARWGNAHDDEHGSNVLASQACSYLLPGQAPIKGVDWAYKSKVEDRDPRRVHMVKGLAVGLAALEAYDRASAGGEPVGQTCGQGFQCDGGPDCGSDHK
jgi:hypothetical protein